MMNIDEWEAALGRDLKKAKFDPEAADPRLAWEVFRRLLVEPLGCDGGAIIQARVETDSRDARAAFLLSFTRLAAVDISDFRLATLELRHVPESAEGWTGVSALEFAVMQTHEFGGLDILPLDEFLDRAYAEGRFLAVLDHPGPWTGLVFIDDHSD